MVIMMVIMGNIMVITVIVVIMVIMVNLLNSMLPNCWRKLGAGCAQWRVVQISLDVENGQNHKFLLNCVKAPGHIVYI